MFQLPRANSLRYGWKISNFSLNFFLHRTHRTSLNWKFSADPDSGVKSWWPTSGSSGIQPRRAAVCRDERVLLLMILYILDIGAVLLSCWSKFQYTHGLEPIREQPIWVPIGTRSTSLQYITPTWGPPAFCMDGSGTGSCNAYAVKSRNFFHNVFRQHYKAQWAL